MRKALTFGLLFTLSCVVTRAYPQSRSANPPARQPASDSLSLGQEALIDRKYDEAIRHLQSASGDRALFLLGNAQFYAQRYQEALAAYDKLLQQFPQSPWRKKALFRKADCYLALKQFDRAAEVYEPELAYIVSDERKEEVAGAYLKYADQNFAPPKNPKGDTPAPNYAKAKTLYQKALEIGLTRKREEEVRFRVAMCDFHLNNFGGALPTLQALVRDFPKGAKVEQAKYYVGLCHLRGGSAREARKTFKDFLSDHPKSDLRADVSYALAETYHVPNPQDAKGLELGVKALRAFVDAFPKHERAVQAEYYIGLSYFNQQRYEDAVKELQSFIPRHAKEDRDELAQAKQTVGLCFLRQKKYREAIAAWQQFLREHPVHRLWDSVQRQVIDAEYAIGDDAYKAKKYDEARKAWQAFQERYPIDFRNADIMFRLGMMLHEEKKFVEAISQWQKVASKYPNTESASRAQFMVAMTYEGLEKFEEAMAAYRAVTGNWRDEAQGRLQAMRQRKLVVYTERTFTTADPPALKLLTRNLKRVSFRAYRVDMTDYFDKLHTVRGVEGLDLSVIEPDERWTLDLKGYQDFKELETAAPLPFKEPGVYAVTCHSEDAEEGKEAGGQTPTLAATTIVLITDLGIITKTTRRDVFVFAENLRAKQPWQGATVIISDGGKTMATGTTDKDGIFHWQPEGGRPQGAGLQNLGEIRIMAYASTHYSSTEGALSSLVHVAGLQPTAFIYTDRPVYRAGQVVHLRGIVRKVEKGVYTFSKGDEFDLTITDPHGAIIRQRKVQLGDFGAFSDSVPLHDEAPVGSYRILLTQKREGEREREGEGERAPQPPNRPTTFSAEGSFEVATYKLEKVRLAIELAKPVYLRGEEIKGKVVAKYYYGEPLARRKVQFGWSGNVGEERETNEKGEFEFTIPTRQFEEEQTVALFARMQEEGAQAVTMAHVAVVGVNVSLSVLRDLHLAGEKFEVTAEAKDLAGKPFAGAFTLKALKREKDEAGRFGEREVATFPVKTDAKDGKGKLSLSLAQSGDYLLRLTGADANGNPVTAELYTQVVGEEDTVKLRILTDSDTFKVGDTASVRVFSRANDNLALVTYEGERIYGYQLVALKKGDNNVKVPMSLNLAPTFQFSIALMDVGAGSDVGAGVSASPQFHSAAKLFRVEHALRITVKPDKKDYRPGDKVRVTIETADQNGKPVAAELSLASVDEALFVVAAGELGAIAEFFLSGREVTESAIHTATSCTFHYAAQAKARVLQVREAESMMRVMLAGVGAGEEIGPGHWAYDYLQQLIANGMIDDPGGKFRGRQNVNRLEAAQALNLAFGRLGISPDESPSFATPLEQRAGGRRGRAGAPGARGLAGAAAPPAQQVPAGDKADAAAPLLGKLAEEFKGELEQLRRSQAQGADERAEKAKAPMGEPPAPARSEAAGGMMPGMGGGAMGGFGGLGGYDGGEGGRVGDRLERYGGGVLQAEGVANVLALDPQSALLVQGGEKDLRELQESLGLSDAQAQALANALRKYFPETCFWDAHVVTDAKGAAAVEFVLPDSLTEWRLTARGVTVETLAGEASEKITASKPFLAELKLPPLLQQGDTVYVTAVLHNNTGKAAKATATLDAQFSAGGQRSRGAEGLTPQTVSLPDNGVQEVQFKVEVPDARSAAFNLKVTTDQPGVGDAVEETVSVRPWGIEHVATAGGTAGGDRLVQVALPEGKYLSRRLTITVGPGVQRALLDAAAAPTGYGYHRATVESVPHRLSAALTAIRYLRALNRSDSPEHQRFISQAEAHIARLIAAQNQDGGWSWVLRKENAGGEKGGPGGAPSDPFITADAFVALAQAERLGFSVSGAAMGKALTHLRNRFQGAGETEYALKSVILYAQSQAGVADFAHANRLHRLRNALDTRSLCHLALTLAQMDRAPMALEVERLVLERVKRASGKAYVDNERDVELTALAALTIARVEPQNPTLPELAEWLWSKRIGSAWGSPRATAYALAALAQTVKATQIAPEKYSLLVSVNDKEVRRLEVAGDARTATIEVPPDLLTGEGAKVNFILQGRGAFSYACVLRGFTDVVAVASAPPTEPQPNLSTSAFRVTRTFLQPPLTLDGKPVPRGFGTVTNARPYENYATAVAAGKHAQVRLSWFIPSDASANVGNYVVLREPIPVGCRVLEDSVRGSFERFERGEAEIVFYYQRRGSAGGSATYDLYGAVNGAYRVLPMKVESFDQPQHYAYADAKMFSVLRRDQKSPDEYKLTPDELYFLGKHSFDKGMDAEHPSPNELRRAESYLAELWDRDADPKGWKLRDEPSRETARMLFALALHQGDAAKTVRFFEVLRERYTSLVIPFREIVPVAGAYKAMGEREREAQVYRATAESSFSREARVAGVLSDEGEFMASVDYLRGLAQVYPDIPNVEASAYALAETVAQRAAQASRQSSEGSKQEAQRLLRMATEQLREFLTLYPEQPVGDEASFALAVALIEQERFREAAAWCARNAERYPKSLFADDYAYIATYANFLGERFDDALQMAERLATTEYPQPDGKTALSPYRPFALYIAAQIHHARGKPADAVKFYAQVAGQFPDAKEAADYFTAKQLKMPEAIAVGEGAPMRVKVTARNVNEAQVSVYKVDLLKFYQNRRSLADIGRMNLAGIKPTWEGAVRLGDAAFVEKERTIDLPMQEKGAYFVVAKALDTESNLQTSGIVVRTDLDVEVQEDTTGGRVRVNVVNRSTGSLQSKAEVWVVGSDNDAFRRGTTDLRGIVFVDDVRGTPTVIAYKEGDYAFYRSEKVLQPHLVRRPTPPPPAVAAKKSEVAPALAFKDQARNLLAQQQREIEGRAAGQLRNQIMGGVGGGGFGGLGGVQVGAVQ